jgi:hypothetical protein
MIPGEHMVPGPFHLVLDINLANCQVTKKSIDDWNQIHLLRVNAASWVFNLLLKTWFVFGEI